MNNSNHPHGGQRILSAGAELPGAEFAVILIHGRGASPENILFSTQELMRQEYAFLVPAASGNTWYPYSFLAPIESNQPGISSGMRVIDELMEYLGENGISSERIVLMGFSQGACLAMEYAAQHARRFGGLVAFSGGIIGPLGMARDYTGSLEGTPVFIGCSDVDFHIPIERVNETADVLESLGGQVEKRIYPGMGHTINADELSYVAGMLETLVAGKSE